MVEEMLLYSVYQAKYFPTSHFLDAKLDCNPSYAWRDIKETIPQIRKGSLRSVGDGRRVQVWKHAWISGIPSSLQSSLQGGIETADMRVRDLLLLGIGKWDVAKIQDIFPTAVDTKILQIAILPTDLIWGLEKSGKFNVKSTYKMIAEDQAKVEGEVRLI